jgi:hypothetical protein
LINPDKTDNLIKRNLPFTKQTKERVFIYLLLASGFPESTLPTKGKGINNWIVNQPGGFVLTDRTA